MIGEVIEASDLFQALGTPIRGKVRDIYTVNDDILLFVASDRISAFDIILKNEIPNKGAILTNLSVYWFNFLSTKIPNLSHHFLSLDLPAQVPEHLRNQYRGRTMQVRKLRVFPIEAIVRGYITGSAWKEYEKHGTVHGIRMSPGLQESQAFPCAMYTPSTKAEIGDHDQNIHPDKVVDLIGPKYADCIKRLSISLYEHAREHARERGIIIADTKFEFGLDILTDEVVLIDEILTPDSSRFWPMSSYTVGKAQSSFDKQYVRDWLIKEGLDGKPDVELPNDIIMKTEEKYKEAFERLVGRSWESVQAENA